MTQKWNAVAKVILTVLFGIAFISAVGGSKSGDGTPGSTSPPVSTSEVTPDQKPPTPKTPAQIAQAKKAAKVEQRRIAAEQEHERKAEARVIADADRKSHEEWDQSGMVLMLPTMKAERGKYGLSKITGTIINRTGKKLAYGQITFNLYDKGGAQVGSALANINGLEEGGRWKFEAVAMNENWSSFKPSEITSY